MIKPTNRGRRTSPPTADPKRPHKFMLTGECRAILEDLADKYGASMSETVEQAIRAYANKKEH